MRIPVSKKTITITILILTALFLTAPVNMGSASNSTGYPDSTPEPVKQYQQDTVLPETPTPIPLDFSEQELEEEQPFGIIIGAGFLVVIIFAGTLITLSRVRPGSKQSS